MDENTTSTATESKTAPERVFGKGVGPGRAAMRRNFYSKAPRKHTTRGAFHLTRGWRRGKHIETGAIRIFAPWQLRAPYAKDNGTSNHERALKYRAILARQRAAVAA